MHPHLPRESIQTLLNHGRGETTLQHKPLGLCRYHSAAIRAPDAPILVFRPKVHQPEPWQVITVVYCAVRTHIASGAFGAPPTPVQRAANVLSDQIEENPDKFFRIDWYPMLDSVRERLAKFIGARKEEVVLVQNATVAALVVLRNFEWRDGDILIGST